MALWTIAPAWTQEEAAGPTEAVPEAGEGTVPALPPATGILPPEAPSSLFRLGAGAAETELSINGSWKASLSSIPTLSFGSQVAQARFSGSPLLFAQSPDLFLSLLVGGSWFLEAAFTDALDESSFALGYRGGEGEIVKEVRAGNQGLSFPSRPFLDFGASGNKSFGLNAALGAFEDSGRGFAAQALLRFDSAKSETAVYIGLERLTELELSASDFIQGRFFVLPDSGLRGIAVYVRNASGSAGSDGFSYALLDPTAYDFSLSAGTVSFDERLPERTLIAYDRSDGLPIQAAETISIDGRSAALAFDPGRRTDCEILSRYLVSGLESQEGMRAEANVESMEQGNLDTLFGTAWAGDVLELYRRGEPDPRSSAGRMPFSALAPEIYEPGVLPSKESPIRIKVSVRQKKERLEIDAKAIPDTVRVRRNGVAETGFVYLPNSGYLELARPPEDGERIEIDYMLPGSGKDGSDFIAEMAYDYFFSDDLSAYAALGARWNAPDGEVSRPETATEGRIGFSSGLTWRNEDWAASLDLGLAYARSDSRDACRIDGMEDFLLVQDASDGTWTRSVAPSGLVEEGRAELLFRDYRLSGAFGVKKLATIESGSLPEAGDPLSRQGPYPVADDTFGTAYVAEFSLSAEKDWCGVQAMIDQSLLDGLARAKSIVLPLRFIQGDGAQPSFILRAGMFGKSPFDGNAEEVPLPDPRYQSGDILLPSAPPGSWAEYEIPLDGPFAAGLRKGASVLILFSSPVPANGRCLVGDLRLKGADYAVEGGISRERLRLEQAYASGPEASFPAELARWRGSSSGNGFLRMEIAGNASRSPLMAYKRLPAFPLPSYRKLSFFVRSSLSSYQDASLSLSASDSGGVFLECGFPLGQSAEWGRVTIDLDQGSGSIVYADGSSQPLQVSLPRAPLSDGATLSWTLSGIEAGIVELDEVGLSDARSSFSYLAMVSASKSKTDTLLSLGGIPILSAVEAKAGARMDAGTESLGYSGQGSAGMKLFPFALAAATSVSGSVPKAGAPSEPAFQSNHSIALPFSFGYLESRFFQDSATGNFNQKDQLKFDFAPISLSAQAGAGYAGTRLGQSWNGSFSAKILSESIGLESSWENQVETPNALEESQYFSAWLGSYAYLAPFRLDASSRRYASLGVHADSAAEGAASRRDFAVAAMSSYANGVSPVRGSEYSISLTPLVKAGKDAKLRILPSYSRKTALSAYGNGLSFGDDLRFLGDAMALLPSTWIGLPFAELFDGKALGHLARLGFDPVEASQEATAGLSVELDAVLGLLQFITPRQASYSLGRISKRVGSVLSESLVHQAGLGMRAVDVFGSQGAFPVVKAFKTDEYGLDQKLKLSQALVGEESSYQYSASLFGIFGFADRDKLDLRDDLRLGSGDERFSESLVATLSLSREAGPSWQGMRSALMERLDSLKREKAAKASSPLAENWLKSRLDRIDSFSAGVTMALDRDGLFSLSAPLAYEWILSAEKAFRFSAGSRLEYGFKGTSSYAQSELSLALSLQAMVEF